MQQLSVHERNQHTYVSNPSSSITSTSVDNFTTMLQLSQLRDSLCLVEHERDALKDRLDVFESQRQQSMKQYELEVESGMLELTKQVHV